jgi:hypothetical protein
MKSAPLTRQTVRKANRLRLGGKKKRVRTFDELPEDRKRRIVEAFQKATRRLDPDYVEGNDD